MCVYIYIYNDNNCYFLKIIIMNKVRELIFAYLSMDQERLYKNIFYVSMKNINYSNHTCLYLKKHIVIIIMYCK